MTDKNKGTVDFQRIKVSEYLTGCVTKWRRIRDDLEFAKTCFPSDWLDAEVIQMQEAAVFYVDAYQSMHMSLFGRLVE